MLLYILVALSLIILVVLLLFNHKSSQRWEPIETPNESVYRNCPLCDWPLKKGERVHSLLYKSTKDAIMHIFGCPYCYKEHPKTKYNNSKRVCPSCNKELKDGEYLMARLFEKPGKNHVHILGCFRCRGRR